MPLIPILAYIRVSSIGKVIEIWTIKQMHIDSRLSLVILCESYLFVAKGEYNHLPKTSRAKFSGISVFPCLSVESLALHIQNFLLMTDR